MEQKNKFKGYIIDLSTQAKKAFIKLRKKDKEAAERIDDKLKDLIKGDPNVDVIKMKGFEHDYRLRCGGDRIIFTEYKHKITILIIKIEQRKNAYRKF